VTFPRRALALLAFVAVWGGELQGERGGAAAADAAAFEDVAREAAPVSDLGMLVAPFVDDCRSGKGELERARCEVVRSALKSRLPGRTFAFTREEADAVLVSDYDARIKGVRLTVVGCLACKQPVDAGSERRFVTLKQPTRGAAGGPVAVEVARATVSFASLGEWETWTKKVKPFLRVELLFQPADGPWTLGASRGYAWRPIGVRVSNRCTGEVVYSQPPSRGPAAKDEPCKAAGD